MELSLWLNHSHETNRHFFLYFVLKPDFLKLPSIGPHSGETHRDLISPEVMDHEIFKENYKLVVMMP